MKNWPRPLLARAPFEMCYMTPSDAASVKQHLWFLQLYLQNVVNVFWGVNSVSTPGIGVNKGKHEPALDAAVTGPTLKRAG